jgi:hypothetical protein
MKIKIEFEHQELNIVLQLLAEAPYKIAAPVVASIQRQLPSQPAGGAKSNDTAT